MISAPSEMRCSEMPRYCITTKVMASTSGIDSATTKPGPHAEADEADHQHDGDGLEQRLGEAADRLLDHDRLIGDEMHADADRQFADDLVHLRLQAPRRTRSRFAPVFMPMARPMAGWPLKRNSACGGST